MERSSTSTISLTELDSILSMLTEDEYRKMKQNVLHLSEKLSKGYYFKQAVNKALKILQ